MSSTKRRPVRFRSLTEKGRRYELELQQGSRSLLERNIRKQISKIEALLEVNKMQFQSWIHCFKGIFKSRTGDRYCESLVRKRPEIITVNTHWIEMFLHLNERCVRVHKAVSKM